MPDAQDSAPPEDGVTAVQAAMAAEAAAGASASVQAAAAAAKAALSSALDPVAKRPFVPFRIMPVALEGSKLAQVPGRLNRVKITLPTVTVATLEHHIVDRTRAALPAGLAKELFTGKRPIVCFFEPVAMGELVSAPPSLDARRIGAACGIQVSDPASSIPTIGCRFCLATEVGALARAEAARMA